MPCFVFAATNFTRNYVNECANNKGGCSDICIDTLDGFNCSCNAGSELGIDGKTCFGEFVNSLLDARYSWSLIFDFNSLKQKSKHLIPEAVIRLHFVNHLLFKAWMSVCEISPSYSFALPQTLTSVLTHHVRIAASTRWEVTSANALKTTLWVKMA